MNRSLSILLYMLAGASVSEAAQQGPPLIITRTLVTGVKGVAYSYQLEATGGTGSFHWTVIFSVLPAGLSLSDKGLISGTPSEAATNLQVAFKVTDDAGLTDQRSFRLTISAVPVAVDDTFGVAAGTKLTANAAANDLYDHTDSPAFSLSTQPAQGTAAMNGDGTFTYTPPAGFTGLISFRYHLQTNSGSSGDAVITIMVLGRNINASCLLDPATKQVIDNSTIHYHGTVTYQGAPVANVTLMGIADPYRGPYVTDGTGGFAFFDYPDYLVGGTYVVRLDSTAGPTTSCLARFEYRPGVLGFGTDPCYNFFSAPTDAGRLALIRRFRDSVLRRNPRGSDYVNVYYRFRGEVMRIFLANPGLWWRSREALERSLPLVHALMRGEKTPITAADAKSVDDVLRGIADRASPELRKAIAGIRHDILNDKLLASFGVGRPEEPQAEGAAQLQRFAGIPLHFEAADEAAGSSVRYLARGPGYDIQLRATGSMMTLGGAAPAIGMTFVGAAKTARISPEAPLAGASNYLTGRDPRKWRTGLQHYGRIRYENIYRDIDLVYYGNQQQLEYDLVIAPGASPGRIALAFSGVEKVRVGSAGDVQLASGVSLRRPVAYQNVDGGRRPVSVDYVLQARNRVGLRVGAYDHSRELIIDPVLSYATLFGGNGLEFGGAIAVDAAGNAYVTGATTSANLQTQTAVQAKYAGGGEFHADAFVTKIDATGTKILYTSYIGGSDDDVGTGIAVDAQGNAYVTGATRSADFPTQQAIQPKFGGAGTGFKTDAFVLKLDPTGSKLLYSTYLGGNQDDAARGIALDSAGNVYVAGITSSRNFPVKNALQSSNRGGAQFFSDAFVTKINAAGNDLVYSTYLGGTGDEAALSIAVDAAGDAYVTGFTYSDDFPLAGPVQKTYGGTADAFVAKVNPAGTALMYSTYLGGASDDFGTGIAVDAQGNSYVAGFTGSCRDFPVVSPAQAKCGSSDGLGFDSFVAKLNSNGTALVYSTFLGGNGRDAAYGLALDAKGSVYVAGDTESTDFASAGALQPRSGGKFDTFLAKLNPNGDSFEYRTYLGGINDEGATAVALDASGNVYVTGSAQSPDALVTYGAFQTSLQGAMDGFIIKIGPGPASPAFVAISSASYSASSGLAAESIASGFGAGLATQITAAGSSLTTTLDNVTVSVKDAAGTERLAPLYLVAPGQINFVVPTGTQPGLASVTVARGGQTIASGVARIYPVAPTLFSADATGSGTAAGFALHVAADGTRTFQLLTTTDPIDLGPSTDQVYLLLFGTGIHNLANPATLTVGGMAVPVLAALPQGQYPGLDQVNAGPLPRALSGKGTVVVQLTVDGFAANPMTVNIR